jgi:hypothetical protein
MSDWAGRKSQKRLWKNGLAKRDITKNKKEFSTVGYDELKLLAIIAAGTKRPSKKRAVNILKVAEALRDLHDLHRSWCEVSKIVKLSPEMIREFIKLLSLTDEVKALVRRGLINSVDIGYRVSKLSAKEQIVLAKNVLGKRLSSGDVRNIVKYRIDNSSISITKAIKNVVDSKVTKIFVAYLGIDKNTNERLEQKYRNKDKAALIKSLFEKLVGKENIALFSLNGRVALIKVSQEGLDRMKGKAKQTKISLSKLADTLVREYLKGCE